MATVSHARFCGVDLHERVAQVCVRDASGEIELERRVAIESETTRKALVDSIVDLGSVRVAVEALGLNRWFVNALIERGLRVRRDLVVVHAASLKLKESGRKTDRRDAREIARRLWLGDLDRVGRTHYPTDAEYDTRQLTRTRHDLVRQRQSMCSRIRSFFRAYAVALPRGTGYGARYVAWLESHVDELPAGAAAARSCVRLLKALNEGIQELDREIVRAAEHSAVAGRLKELPQIADLTALTIACELGDLDRFKNTRAVARYGGLVPRVNSSANNKWHGPLDKHGNRELRWIFGQWAVRLLSKVREVRQWAERRLHRMSKNRLRTALARRLLVGVYASLRDGVPFCLTRCLGN